MCLIKRNSEIWRFSNILSGIMFPNREFQDGEPIYHHSLGASSGSFGPIAIVCRFGLLVGHPVGHRRPSVTGQ